MWLVGTVSGTGVRGPARHADLSRSGGSSGARVSGRHVAVGRRRFSWWSRCCWPPSRWCTQPSAGALPTCDKTWTGAIDDDYTTGGNWSPSGVPTATQYACAGINDFILFESETVRAVRGVNFPGGLEIVDGELRIGTTTNGFDESVVGELVVTDGRRGGRSPSPSPTCSPCTTVDSARPTPSPRPGAAPHGGASGPALASKAACRSTVSTRCASRARRPGRCGDITLCDGVAPAEPRHDGVAVERRHHRRLRIRRQPVRQRSRGHAR